MHEWRNWNTRQTKDLVSAQGMWVRVPPRVPPRITMVLCAFPYRRGRLATQRGLDMLRVA